jgi:hypothetical protein
MGSGTAYRLAVQPVPGMFSIDFPATLTPCRAARGSVSRRGEMAERTRSTRSVAGLGGPASDAENDQQLIELDAQLVRLRRRAARQRRQWQGLRDIGDDAATTTAATWSQTIEDAFAIATEIAQQPAHDLDGLNVKFSAIWWWLALDDAILDASAKRWLRAFGKSLARAAHRKR